MLALFWGWSLAAGLVFGLALSVASTVVLLRALELRGAVETDDGRIAIGWLIVEDLAMVFTLVLLPSLAGPRGDHALSGIPWATLAWTVGKLVAFVVIMLVVGVRVFPWVLRQAQGTGSREVFTLAVLALALGVAFGSAQLFGVSFALGAFVAGVVIHESDLSRRAADEALPLRDAFAVLFFVSVGMLFDPSILVRQPLEVLAVVAIIIAGKSIAAFGIVMLFRHPASTALAVSASLAQIGEFSFILAGLGITLGILPAGGPQSHPGGGLALDHAQSAGVSRERLFVPSARRSQERACHALDDRARRIEAAVSFDRNRRVPRSTSCDPTAATLFCPR